MYVPDNIVALQRNSNVVATAGGQKNDTLLTGTWTDTAALAFCQQHSISTKVTSRLLSMNGQFKKLHTRRLLNNKLSERNLTVTWDGNDRPLVTDTDTSITACAVATSCCISDVAFQREKGNVDFHSSYLLRVTILEGAEPAPPPAALPLGDGPTPSLYAW